MDGKQMLINIVDILTKMTTYIETHKGKFTYFEGCLDFDEHPELNALRNNLINNIDTALSAEAIYGHARSILTKLTIELWGHGIIDFNMYANDIKLFIR
jgi:hypothetical protein